MLCSNSQELLIKALKGEDIVQFKNNTLPKGVITFEDLFKKYDQLKKGKILASPKNFKELKITPNKVLKVVIKNSFSYIDEIAKITKDFASIMASSYDDLKVFKKYVIQHII